MGRKRTGSIYTKDGALWYALQLRSGKRHARRVPPLPDGRAATEAQARTYVAELIRRYELGLWDPEAPDPARPGAAPPAAPVPTVAEFGRRWVDALTHASKGNEDIFLRRHVEGTELGAKPITEVTPQDVLAWVRQLAQKPSGHKSGGTIAPKTVRAMFGALKRLFRAAVFERAVASTPCVLPPGSVPRAVDKVPGARRHWRSRREEVEALISDVQVPADRHPLWALFFLAGLRAGEVFALRWRHYDPRRRPLGCLTVERSYSTARRVEKGTKTGAVREVPVHPTLAAVLAEWRLSGWERAHGRRPTPDDLVVPNERGAHRTVDCANRSLTVDCRALEVVRRRLHGMRHTFISLAIDDGARADVLQKVTHTRPQTSAFDVYREESWETLCAEVAKLKVRRVEALPLWQVASSGGGAAGGTATDTATDSTRIGGNTVNHSASLGGRSHLVDERRPRAAAESTAIPGAGVRGPLSNPAQPDTADTGSATGSATPTGPHTGEAWLYDWVDRTLLDSANEDGTVPDAGEVTP